MRVEPALEDKRGGELVDFVATRVGIGGIMAGGFEDGVSLGGREAFVPEVNREADREAGAIYRRACFGKGLGDECFEFINKAVDALGLAATVSREMQRIADDDAGAAVAAQEAEDRTLVPTRLGALDGEQRLGDTERIGERDPDAARADIEAEPRLGHTHFAMIGKLPNLRSPTLPSHKSRAPAGIQF